MHIVDSTLFFAPHSGGVKRYLLAKHAFLSVQHQIRHSLLVPGARDAESMPGIFEFSSPKIPCTGGYRLPLRMSAWQRKIVSLEPDVIEVGDPYHLAWSALAAAQELGVPSVAFAHSNLPDMLQRRFGRAIGRVANAYVRRLYKHFDLVMAPSRSVATYLRAIGIENVIVQSLGVDARVFHPRRNDPTLRHELGLPADTRLLIFAGRMAREKRIDWLVRAVEELGSPYHLVMVGAQAGQRINDRVTLLPYQQGNADLARLLASADALVHAGVQETFGMVFIEAMACGRPVIGMRSGAVLELIDDSVGRIAEPDDIGSLKSAIASLYEADLDQLGANARRRVEQSYTWHRVFGRQLDVYSRLHRRQPLDLLCADPAI